MKKIRIVPYIYVLALGFVGLLLMAEPALAQNTLQNPLKFKSIGEFIAGVLRILVMIAIPILTLFMVYAGFKFIAAQGNSSKLSDAKKNFVYVIFGGILIMGAWVIATLIAGTVKQLTG